MWRSHCGAAETNPTSDHELEDNLASCSGLRIERCCELGGRPAAVAPIRPLAWESPNATGAALKKQKQNKMYSLTDFMSSI